MKFITMYSTKELEKLGVCNAASTQRRLPAALHPPTCYGIFSARQHMLSVLYAVIRLSVRPSVRHMGESAENG